MDRLSVGLDLVWYRLDISGGELELSENYPDAGMSLLVRPLYWIDLGLTLENMRALFEKDDCLCPFSWGAGIALRPVKGLSLMYNLGRDLHGYVNTVSVTAHILPFCSLSCGYGRETMTSSAAVTVLFRKMSLSYGIRQHPYLGMTHVLALSIRSLDTGLPSLEYGNRNGPKRPDNIPFEALDVRVCSLEDLKTVPVLNEVMAGRIIAYRESIGPLSEKALFQIGLSSGEISELMNYVYGLHSGKDEKPAEKAGRPRMKKRLSYSESKKLFMTLVNDAGISVSEAMGLCDSATREGRESFYRKLEAGTVLDAAEKKKVRDLCERYWLYY